MAIYDWNHDGKKNIQDDFIEYQIINNSTDKDSSNVSRGKANGNTSYGVKIIGFIVFIGIICLIGLIMYASEPKCIESGCNNKQVPGSNYCHIHKMYTGGASYSHSSSSDYDGTYDNDSSLGGASSDTHSGDKSDAIDNSMSGSGAKNNDSEGSSDYSSGYDSYDDGYDDIYMDGDYDDERYNNDSDYADGVDDAMDEFEEDEDY